KGSPRGEEFADVVRKLAALVGVPFPEWELTQEEKEAARRSEARRGILETVTLACQQALWSDAGLAAREHYPRPGFGDDDLQALEVGFYLSVGEIKKALQAAGYDLDEAKAVGPTNLRALAPASRGFCT